MEATAHFEHDDQLAVQLQRRGASLDLPTGQLLRRASSSLRRVQLEATLDTTLQAQANLETMPGSPTATQVRDRLVPCGGIPHARPLHLCQLHMLRQGALGRSLSYHPNPLSAPPSMPPSR
jgi:hypothetical protein